MSQHLYFFRNRIKCGFTHASNAQPPPLAGAFPASAEDEEDEFAGCVPCELGEEIGFVVI